jgi:hypothetical protein
MVNLISSEPKTGCYLLLILSNLQALKRRSSGVRGVTGVQEPVMAPLTLTATTGSESLLGLQLGDRLHPELLICIFPLNAAC